MKYDVTALGELLIDFTHNDISSQGNSLFEANPGGAPCNVLAMLTKLGYTVSFVGKVGDDAFGHMLARIVANEKIDISGLHFETAAPTTLAFVHRLADGDRDFSFYRNPGADMLLNASEVPEEQIASSRIFHFGSLSMTNDGNFAATQKAIELAEQNSVLRSFDPNLRPPLWQSLSLARERIRYGLAHCDILKIADNELAWLTGSENSANAVRGLRREFDISCIFVSMGSAGSQAYMKDCTVWMPAFLNPDSIDTTGAGDTFCACMLHGILQHGIDELNEYTIGEMLRFGNAAASIVTTRRGALRVMPTREEVEKLMSTYDHA